MLPRSLGPTTPSPLPRKVELNDLFYEGNFWESSPHTPFKTFCRMGFGKVLSRARCLFGAPEVLGSHHPKSPAEYSYLPHRGVIHCARAASLPKMLSELCCLFGWVSNLCLPPGGRGTAAGFPEANIMSFGGSRDSGGRSLRI